jgi:hypothetical protein
VGTVHHGGAPAYVGTQVELLTEKTEADNHRLPIVQAMGKKSPTLASQPIATDDLKPLRLSARSSLQRIEQRSNAAASGFWFTLACR